jgi:hypothetical protein
MDTRRVGDTSPLQVACPHCGHAEPDDYECLDGDCLQAIRCAHCASTFHVAVMTCEACANETLYTWTQRPTSQQFAALGCDSCDLPYPHHETAGTAPELSVE